MVGFDAATGKRLWTVPDCIANYNAPLPWEHGGKTYFIGCNLSGIKCVEAAGGKALWVLASTEDHVVHNGGMQGAIDGDLLLLEDAVDVSGDRKRNGKVGLSCYRLTVSGPEKLWRFDCGGTIGIGANDKTGMSPLVYRGYAYFQMPSRPKRAWCIDMKTGKAVATISGSAGMRYGNTVGVTDKILTPGGIFGAGADFRSLSGGGRDAIKCTAYSGPCVADGYLYTRDNRRVYCYDLRAK
jgi:hypothetical protein